MKQNLLFFFIVFSFAWQGFSQATAFNAPNLVQCNNEVFNLSIQDNIILGSQPQPQFVVNYFTTNTDAQANANPIANPGSFPVSVPFMTIFARVTNTVDNSFDTTVFTLTVNFAFAPNIPDVSVCSSYTLPALQQGTYYHAPGGTGAPIAPGTQITETTMVYVYVDSGANCTDEESFVVTVVPSPNPGPIYDVYSCGPYILPDLPNNGIYYIDGTETAAGITISESVEVGVAFSNGNCGFNSGFHVFIQQPELAGFTVLDICNTDGNPYGVFDLQSYANEISWGNPNVVVTFYETQTDADFGMNPIQNLSNYVTVTQNQQTIYIRVEYGGDPNCSANAPLILQVNSCTLNTISGNIRFDYDNNGCTASDAPAGNMTVSLTNGSIVKYAYTDANGNYSYTNVQMGNNVISIPSNFAVATPLSYTVNVTGGDDAYEGNDFCLTQSNIINDVMVQIYPNGNARPGFQLTYTVAVTNLGTAMAGGTVTLSFDNGKLQLIGSNPASASQTGNTVTFNYSDLLPFEVNSFYVYFTVFAPPAVNAGDVLDFTATALASADINLANNTATYQQQVVNSYDPNDIMVLEGAYITEAQADGYLNYIVRFQNTGTASAVNVRIDNRLDPNLDWSTFTPIAGSHTYQAQRSEDEVTFQFDNIMLPASQDDELGSHGFIAYRVKPVMDFEEGEIISNTASIFFDYNAPIITNTVTTQIQSLGVPGHSFSDLRLYPNPATDRITIQLNDSYDLQVGVYDLQGKRVIDSTPEVSNNAASVDISNLSSGLYLVKVDSGNQTVTKKLIVK